MVTATVLPPNISGIVGGGSVEFGQNVTLAVSFNASSPDQSYQWSKGGAPIAGATSASYSIAAVSAADAGTYTVVVTNSAGSSVASTDVTVKALAAPAITSQPRALVVQVGQSATFSYVATGSYPRTHQWRKSGVDIDGATNSTYTIASVGTADAGTYSVVVANSQGSVTSTAASLTVNAAVPPIISSGYPFDATATQGGSVSFSLFLSSGSSPFTYQWFRNGAAISGATNSQLTFNPVALADAGKYSVTVSNVAGAVTSREATLTVNPPTPVSIYSQPQGQRVYAGQSASFGVSVNGSSPVTYQWQKNGTPIAGATSSYYSINSTVPADAGSYSVVVTNAAGSVASSAAVLTVNPPVAPTITQQPTANQTVLYGSSFSLSVQSAGSPTLTYQWRKDGVSLGSGATSSSYYVYNVTPANSGVYTVVVANSAGSVTSEAANITVLPAAAPTITAQPPATQIAQGLSASLSVTVNATGTGSLNFQWQKDGIAIPGATSGTYNLSSIRAADAGSYTVVITGPGGTVTSTAAKLTVLPPAPPQATYGTSASVTYATLGQSLNVYFYSSIDGSPPFSYQWSHNGVPIPGATSTSYSVSSTTAADYGDYVLTIANEGGVFTLPPIKALPPYYSVQTFPWMDAAQLGETVYLLSTSPGRIDRYDLAGERWLPTVYLTDSRAPTAFLPTAEGFYIAYGRTIARRSLDLSTETALLNTPADVTQMFAFENYLYYGMNSASGSNIYSTFNRSTLLAGPDITIGYWSNRQVAIAPTLRKGFAWSYGGSPTSMTAFTFAANGTIATTSTISSTMPAGSRVFVSPDDKLVMDDAGAVYRASDLAYIGSLGDRPNAVAFFGDGTPIVLRGATVSKIRVDNFQETGRGTVGNAGLRIFTRGSNAFVFGANSGTGDPYTVKKITADALASPLTPTTPTLPARYSVDDAFVGADNVVHVFSRTVQGLVRWSPVTRTFLATIPLRGAPILAFHQPGNNRALFAYGDGYITQVALSGGANQERALGIVAHRIRALVDAGDLAVLNLADGQDSGDFRLVLDAAGKYLTMSQQSLYYGTGLAWIADSRRFYSTPSYGSALQYENLSTTGTITAGSSAASNLAITTPIRFNAAQSLLVSSNGRVVNADLASIGILANNIADGAWLDSGLLTIRAVSGATEVQQWAPASYLLAKSTTILGLPIRILRLSDNQAVVVTNVLGAPSFTVLNDDLSVATTPTPAVTFSRQPAAQTSSVSGSASFSVSPQGTSGTVSYEWTHNGQNISGATSNSYSLTNVQPADAGLYAATARDSTNTATSDPAILGLSSSAKVIGSGSELRADVHHPNGNIYDQVLLSGAAATMTADAGQVLRTSYVDSTNDIVQVEFSGAGTLSIVLENSSAPAVASNYNQPDVLYVKGHAGIVITGANETTNLSVFSVGRMTAVDQSLFKSNVTYDGMADLAFIAIASSNGKFGGLRAADVNFFNTHGVTGVYAPNVQFAGPLYIGDINAFDNAVSEIVVGSVSDARITGGNLFQSNGQAVRVSGLSKLKFADGTDSHGNLLPAQANQARLEDRGSDVTSQTAVNPGP